MPVSHLHKCCFIHIPKTGGTSVEAALGIRGDWRIEDRNIMYGLIQSADLLERKYLSAFLQHLSYSELRNILPPAAVNFFSFSFVRNPWERMVSVYARKDPHMMEYAEGRGLKLDKLSFPAFVEEIAHLEHIHLQPQHNFICDAAGKQLVDFVGRFENLQADFAAVCNKIGAAPELPRLNASQHTQYRDYYDGSARKLVESRYAADIDLFGYTF